MIKAAVHLRPPSRPSVLWCRQCGKTGQTLYLARAAQLTATVRDVPCQVLGWTLVNSTVALAGYYFSAFTVDKPWMGRRRLQVRVLSALN